MDKKEESIVVSLEDMTVILMQLWKFIAPGLYKNEKKALLPYLLATPILFFAGGAMVYYLIAPLAWNFFLSYQNLNSAGVPIRLEAKMGEYLALMMRFIFAFGLAFQLPVVVSLLAKANLVQHQTLRKFRKYNRPFWWGNRCFLAKTILCYFK